MKVIFLVIVLFSINSYAGNSDISYGQVPSSGLIENDTSICGPVRRNAFKDLTINLKRLYDTTLEESYFKIKCSGKDILGMVVEDPADRYFVGMDLKWYFEKKIDRPEIFSQILVNKVNARDILSRIDYTLEEIKGTDLVSIYNKKLYSMKKKYTAFLKKHPVSGSAESLSSSRQRAKNNPYLINR